MISAWKYPIQFAVEWPLIPKVRSLMLTWQNLPVVKSYKDIAITPSQALKEMPLVAYRLTCHDEILLIYYGIGREEGDAEEVPAPSWTQSDVGEGTENHQ